MSESAKQQPATDTDPRFPSGEWTGFFLQPRLYNGRVWMELYLRFAAGQLDGVGSDRVGPFLVEGMYALDTGTISFRKRYGWQSPVDYSGYAEMRHGAYGIWRLPDQQQNGWHIWPRCSGEHDRARVAERIEEPTDGGLVGAPR